MNVGLVDSFGLNTDKTIRKNPEQIKQILELTASLKLDEAFFLKLHKNSGECRLYFHIPGDSNLSFPVEKVLSLSDLDSVKVKQEIKAAAQSLLASAKKRIELTLKSCYRTLANLEMTSTKLAAN